MAEVEHRLMRVEEMGEGMLARWICSCGTVGEWRHSQHARRGHSMHRARLTAPWSTRARG